MGTLLDQTLTVNLTPPLRLMLQSLSNNDDDTENIGKKMNLYSFKLYHVYLDPLSLSNVSYVSRVWILRDLIRFKKRKESLLLYVHILHKIRILRRFHVTVVQWTEKMKRNVLKTMTHLQSCCFAHKTNYCLLTLLLPSLLWFVQRQRYFTSEAPQKLLHMQYNL